MSRFADANLGYLVHPFLRFFLVAVGDMIDEDGGTFLCEESDNSL